MELVTVDKLLFYINSFKNQKILVVGDLIADKFVIGDPERLSREAPVLILRHRDEHILPGGGANAASNIASLQAQVSLAGLLGDDLAGKQLQNELIQRKINIDNLIVDNSRPTSVKMRVLAGGEQIVKQQVVRIDHLEDSPLKQELEEKFLDELDRLLQDLDGILLSDYGNGLFTKRIRQEIIAKARKLNIPVAVDSRYNLAGFKQATIATPNLEEASAAVGRELLEQAEVDWAGEKLREELLLDYLLITQGGAGMTLFSADKVPYHIPAANFSEVFDVTGAGDTVVGTLLLALAAGAQPEEAIHLANHAAGIVVRKSGVATVDPVELRAEVKKNA